MSRQFPHCLPRALAARRLRYQGLRLLRLMSTPNCLSLR